MLLRAATALLIGLGAVPVAAQTPDTAQTCTAVAVGGLPGISGRREDYIRAVSLRSTGSTDVLIRRPSHRTREVEVPCDEPWRLEVSGTDAVPTMRAVAGSFD